MVSIQSQRCSDHTSSLKRCPMKRAMPIPIGASQVDFDLTAASMITVMTNMVVVNISMKRPRTTEVPLPSRTWTGNGPGNRADEMPAAAMPPSICAVTMTKQRMAGTAPTSHRVKVTCEQRSEICPDPPYSPTYRRIQLSSTDPIKDPDIDGHGAAKAQRNIE